jgi:hypothetical protein
MREVGVLRSMMSACRVLAVEAEKGCDTWLLQIVQPLNEVARCRQLIKYRLCPSATCSKPVISAPPDYLRITQRSISPVILATKILANTYTPCQSYRLGFGFLFYVRKKAGIIVVI